MSFNFHQPYQCTVNILLLNININNISLPWNFSIYCIKYRTTESQTKTEMTRCLNNIAHQWITNQQNGLLYDYNFIIAAVWLMCWISALKYQSNSLYPWHYNQYLTYSISLCLSHMHTHRNSNLLIRLWSS